MARVGRFSDTHTRIRGGDVHVASALESISFPFCRHGGWKTKPYSFVPIPLSPALRWDYVLGFIVSGVKKPTTVSCGWTAACNLSEKKATRPTHLLRIRIGVDIRSSDSNVGANRWSATPGLYYRRDGFCSSQCRLELLIVPYGSRRWSLACCCRQME